MNPIIKGGFGYCYKKEHTYITIWETKDGYQIELLGHKSRLVPDLFDQEKDEYIIWILVRELEKEIA